MIRIGIDEAGRGPWAGPICAAAVALEPHQSIPTATKDSKALSAKARETIAASLKNTVRFGIATIPAEEIDQLGLGRANSLAFETAYLNLLFLNPDLKNTPHEVYIDGRPCKTPSIPNPIFQTKGESHYREIAAASILAKTHRDHLMEELHVSYPNFEFSLHKGYGTQLHQQKLSQFGPLPGIHRISFKPIAKLLHT